MRRLMTLGLVSAAALMAACGDDESGGNGGTANNGGSSGANNGGSAGNAQGGSSGANNGGSSGANNGGSTNGGSGGGDNNGGSGSDPDAGDGGGGPPCTGCVELRVPVTGINQRTLFQFSGTEVDMSNAVITYRIAALTIDNQLTASPFAQDADFGGFEQRFVNLDTGNGFNTPGVFVDVTHDLASADPVDVVIVPNADAGDAGDAGGTAVPVASDFDKSRVFQFGLNVGSAGAFTAFPATVTVLIDSVTFTGVDSNVRPNVTFDDDAEGFAVNGFQPQPGSVVIHHPAD